jgi:hypothetical protein
MLIEPHGRVSHILAVARVVHADSRVALEGVEAGPADRRIAKSAFE